MTVRTFLTSLLVGVSHVLAAAAPSTHVYKRVGSLDIRADVYEPPPRDGEPADALRPAVVWIHGGALINGHREGLFRPLHDALLARGCVVVSIDYRLAPETKLPEIAADVDDAFRWLRTDGARRFRVDPNRVAAFGGSAGGFLTLLAGARVSPKPRALVSLWGYGEVLGPWGTAPSPHARHHQTSLTPAAMRQLAAGPPVADSRDRRGDGGAFYQTARRDGSWPRWVTGFDPATQADRIRRFLPLDHVTDDYPPTLLIHGTADTDVPYQQSHLMLAALKKHGVEHRLITFEGAEHGLPGVEPDKLAAAYAEAVEFLLKHLK